MTGGLPPRPTAPRRPVSNTWRHGRETSWWSGAARVGSPAVSSWAMADGTTLSWTPGPPYRSLGLPRPAQRLPRSGQVLQCWSGVGRADRVPTSSTLIRVGATIRARTHGARYRPQAHRRQEAWPQPPGQEVL